MGSSLARHMQAQGISESELAARAGMSQSYISRILTGEVTNPTIEFVMRLARALRITTSELVGETPGDPSQLLLEIQARLEDLERLVKRLQEQLSRRDES